MKKLAFLLVLIALFLTTGFTYKIEKSDVFLLDELAAYQKRYNSEEIEVCSSGKAKSYMNYLAITNRGSKQYKYIRNYMTVDKTTGLLVDSDGFIGVALGSYFGDIGERYYFTLESGIILPVVKCEEKADKDVYNGCNHRSDNSVIEFVIDTNIAEDFFGRYSNGYILQGNFSNYDTFSGEIVKIERVLDELNPNFVTYMIPEIEEIDDDVFNYASGY